MISHDFIENLDFFGNTITAVNKGSNEFIEKLLFYLYKTLNIKAISFYSYDNFNKILILKKQFGLDYNFYKNFERHDSEPFPEEHFEKQKLIIINNVMELKSYAEKDLAEKFSLRSMIAMPLFLRDFDIEDINYDESKMPIKLGVIFVYLKSDSDVNVYANYFSKMENYFANLFLSSVKNDKFLLRKEITYNALISTDLNSFLHRSLYSTLRYLSIEAGSIFLWDKDKKLLRLHGTTGLDPDQKKSDVNYRSDENTRTTCVALYGSPIISPCLSGKKEKKGKFIEKITGNIDSYCFLPILDWTLNEPLTTLPLGVFRFVNKKTSIGSSRKSISFSWEDISVLRFINETISAIVNIVRKTSQREKDFNKILHGVRSNIEAVLMSLEHFENRPESITIKYPEMTHYIKNCISHMIDVKGQIERMVSIGQNFKISCDRVLIAGDVLAKIISLAKKIALSLNVKKLEISNLVKENFFNTPPVSANIDGLLTVFRNLVENAMKYSDPYKSECKIDFNYVTNDDYLNINVIDYGIGVPENLDEWIFIEGFRGDNAVRKFPAGGGLGLGQSREIMREMGGDIIFQRATGKTIFTVKIPLWHESKEGL